MESGNVALARRMWDAYERFGLPGILDYAAPEAEWRPFSAGGRTFASTADYARYIEDQASRHEVVESKLFEIHAQGDCVVVSGRLRMRGPDGLVDNPMHWVHRFRDGRIVFTASYPVLDDALAAAGLAPEDRVSEEDG
jgi:ketosteroid isomerase-like protein